ncbi:MAG: protease, partial [Planctomycetaceae bacterium]|nr:protease [Planctomycetaceae bacterium]
MLRTSLIFAILFAFALLSNLNASEQGTRFLRNPDVGPEQIAFVHANDIWLVSREGGNAFRLTSGQGEENHPAFSPDGQWIAFTGQYGGNSDVYVVSVKGGEPKRLTWHPGADIVQGWTPDGQIMFQSGRAGQPTRLWQFYQVSPEGGFPHPIALPQAYDGEMSADGKWIAYQEIGLWDPEWRNYRGGQAQPIGIVSTDNWERMIPPWEGERHLSPVWLDGVVYYISERDYAANVWSFNPKTKEHRQMTRHADFDVKSLGAGNGVLVYEQAGYLHVLNPSKGEPRRLVVDVARDMTWSRPRWEEISADSLQNAQLSPTGKRA